MARGAGAGARDRPGPGLGVRARGRVRLRRPGARLLRAPRPAPSSRPRRCSACSRRRTTSAASARASSRRRPKRPSRRRCWASSARSSRRAQIDAWADELAAGACPAPIREQLYKILFKPDKNAPEYKAVVEAARRAQRAPLDLLKAAGAIDSPYQFHWRRFLFENFPKGTAFPALQAPADQGRRCRWPRRRRSRSTTRPPPRSTMRCRCRAWAAARCRSASTSPRRALAIAPDSALDKVARERLSTVYMPGYKLTMLPDAVVQAYTLTRRPRLPGGVACTSRFDEATLAAQGQRDPARARADRRQPAPRPARQRDHRSLARRRRAGRLRPCRRTGLRLPPGAAPEGAARGGARQARDSSTGPTTTSASTATTAASRAATSSVQISTRLRGAPLDLIVAEAMILANSTWGGWLADCGVPGIYRSQASLAPGVKVRMGTKPAPHAGIGVAQYTWATLAAAALRRPGQPVADHRLRAPRPHRGAGRAVQAARTRSCSPSSRASTRPTPPTTTSSTASSATGRCAGWQQNGVRELDATRDEGRPGARRRRCRWCSARWAPRACRAARGCACASAASTC